jgi:hypothetical protein
MSFTRNWGLAYAAVYIAHGRRSGCTVGLTYRVGNDRAKTRHSPSTAYSNSCYGFTALLEAVVDNYNCFL